MAAVSAWGKPGAWAAAVEEEEKETIKSTDDGSAEPQAEFPSLAAAVATKTKKKKGTTLSLAEFAIGHAVSHGSAGRSVFQSVANDEVLNLPTGPRERTPEELERTSSRGFGYSSYGGRGGPRDEGNPRWGSGSGYNSRVSDESRRGGLGGAVGGGNRDLGSSRADEVDDWGAGKRSAAPPSERRRESGFFDSQSRADESESWLSNKTAPSLSEGRRINGRGGGFDGPRERRGVGFDALNKEGADDGGGASSDSWMKKRDEPSSRGRPRLVLQPRSLPLANESNGENVTKSRGSNPFGEARPREEVLAEKGQDWKKIDEKLDSMKIRETPLEGAAAGRKEQGNGNGVDRAERNWRKLDEQNAPPAARAGEMEEALPAN